MRRYFIFLALIAVVLLGGKGSESRAKEAAFQPEIESSFDVAAVDVAQIKTESLSNLKMHHSVDWWAEFGDLLVIGGNHTAMTSAVKQLGAKIQNIRLGVELRNLRVVVAAHNTDLPPNHDVVAKSGRVILTINNDLDETTPEDAHFLVKPFVPDTVYVRASQHDQQPLSWGNNQNLQAKNAMNAVDPARWYSDVGTLSSWNRHISSPEVITARDWIKSQFDALHPTTSTLQKFSVYGRDAWNVVATFDAGPSSDIYIVGGHYDSISERTADSAPGAEDNATGAAAVIEMARVFSSLPKSATLVFITFSGEEEGLIGSKAYVRSLDPTVRARVKAMLNMDMIGYSKDESEDVLLESSSRYRALVDQYAAASRLVDGLKYYTSFNPYGSDHMPFIEADIPAILTIDNDWGDYPSYHRTSDTIDKVSRDMGAAILKMNAGALAALLSTQ